MRLTAAQIETIAKEYPEDLFDSVEVVPADSDAVKVSAAGFPDPVIFTIQANGSATKENRA